MSDEGRKKLAGFAKQLREKVTPAGASILDKKGLDLVQELSKDLTGSEGMPGLRLYRDTPAKFRVQRPPRNAQITIDWQREIGALVVTAEKHGEPKTLSRYLWEEAPARWRSMEASNSDLYDDLMALLVDCLYPEGK